MSNLFHRTVESEHRRAQTPQIEVEALSAALADACDLLEGWVNFKCAKRLQPEHMAHIAKLRATIAKPQMSADGGKDIAV